jgi:hypothetical protein
VETVRRFLGLLMIGLAVVGLLPLVTLAFGYNTGTVSTGSASRYPAASAAPATRYISCTQDPATYSETKGLALSADVVKVKCYNNWVKPLNVTVSLQDANNSSIYLASSVQSATISPGGFQCVTLSVSSTKSWPKNTSFTVSYLGMVSSGDLSASFGFTGNYRWVHGAFTNTYSCP